jgi:heat shock protein HtpX
MSITQARFTSQLRTWVLVAGLTALLIGIGALIGGKFLYIFVIFAVAMNVAGYWFSDKIALSASRAKPVSEQEAPQLYKILRELTERAELPMPRVYTIPSEQPNAFATGRNAKHAAVAVTEGLMQLLPEDQIRGVLAHELSHVKNHDILVTSVAAMIAGAIAAVANILQFSFLFGGFSDDEDSPLGFIGALATIILAPIAAALLQMAVSRQREFLADATGARLLGTGKPLADALESLEQGVQAAPLQVNPATASLYIVHPFRAGQGLSNMFSTHPPLAERIRRLREYDAAQGIHYG